MNEVGGGQWCANCNVGNLIDATFCSYCGAALGRPDLPPSGLPVPAPPPSGWAGAQMPAVQTGYAQPHAYQAQLQPYPAAPLPYAPQPSPYAAGPFPVPGQAGYQYAVVPTVPPQGMPAYAPQAMPPYGSQPMPAYAPQPYAPQPYGEQPAGAHYGGMPPGISINVSPVINVQAPVAPPAAPSPIVVLNNARPGPGLVVRALWFLFVGLWLGALATAVGWALCVGVVTLPIGLLILNRLPAIMTLRPASTTTQVAIVNGVTMIQTGVPSAQQPFLLRAVYFVLVGWWLSALWLALAWVLVALALVTFGLTLAPAFLMFDRTPQVLTLRNN